MNAESNVDDWLNPYPLLVNVVYERPLGVKYVRTGEDFYSNWLRFIGVGTFRSEFGSWEVSLKQFTRSK